MQLKTVCVRIWYKKIDKFPTGETIHCTAHLVEVTIKNEVNILIGFNLNVSTDVLI